MSYQPYDRNPSGVIFFGTNSTDQTFESASTLVYDSGNNRLGINNAAPGGSLHVDNLQMNGNTLSTTNTNGSLILSPNGNGSIQRDSGGNARGTYAIDFQTTRGLASQVANGIWSVIAGGASNSIGTGSSYGVISGGSSNTISNYSPISVIGGGAGNIASCFYVTIGGGRNNCGNACYAVVGGGYTNTASCYGTVGGGYNNTASGYISTIGGGSRNSAICSHSTIGGGSFNSVSGNNSLVSGGCCNITNARHSTINGGHRNIIQSPTNECCSRGVTIGGGVGHNSSGGTLNATTGDLTGTITCCNAGAFSTIGGGLRNCATGCYSTISGGCGNTINSCSGYGFGFSSIGGGSCNTVSGDYSTVSGGSRNTASGDSSTVGGGYCNLASWISSTVGGGYCNTASENFSTISGGNSNIASCYYSTVGGGKSNSASGYSSTVSGGYCNTASGRCSTVSGGAENLASGDYSSVVGYCNSVAHTNSHIIGSGITSSAADTLYTNKICANNTITGTSIIKSGGTSSQFLKADGSVDSTVYTTCVGTVTSVAAGNGMNFGTITTTGSVALGTPSNVTLSSTNSVTSNSHTHAFAPGGDTTEYIRGDGSLATFPTNVASGVGSAGHIAFWTATNSLSYDNNELFWDQTNNRLGVGTGSPSYELDIDGSGRFTGTLNVNGDLIVNGTTTTVNSTVVTIEDPILVLGSGTPTTDDNKDRGIAFNYFDGSAKQGFFGYDDNEQKFTFMTDATIAGEVVSGTVGTIKADLVGDVTGNADTATLATDANGLTSAVTIQLGGQLSGSDTFQDAGDTATITASLTSNAITDQTEITSVDGTNDHILIYDSGVGLRKVTPQSFIDDLNIVTSFNVSDGTTNVTVEQGETLSFADGTGAEFVVTNNAGQPTITVNSVDSEIVHDNLSGFVGNEHIDHSAVILTAGSGLIGGGDITSSRRFDIVGVNGISVAEDNISLASTVAGSGLNYSAGVLNIGAGTGMSINSTTVGLANTTVAANSYGSASAVATFTVDAQGRLTAAATTAISITASQVSDFNTASESAIFTAANFVDGTTIDFTVTTGASVTAEVKDSSITEAKLSRTVDATFSNNDVINADINLVSGGAGGITVKLPAPATGKMVYVKKIDSAVGAVTVERNGASDSIDGATQKILYSQYESLSFVSDGTHWYIV